MLFAPDAEPVRSAETALTVVLRILDHYVSTVVLPQGMRWVITGPISPWQATQQESRGMATWNG
jgi:hypothetical protein